MVARAAGGAGLVMIRRYGGRSSRNVRSRPGPRACPAGTGQKGRNHVGWGAGPACTTRPPARRRPRASGTRRRPRPRRPRWRPTRRSRPSAAARRRGSTPRPSPTSTPAAPRRLRRRPRPSTTPPAFAFPAGRRAAHGQNRSPTTRVGSGGEGPARDPDSTVLTQRRMSSAHGRRTERVRMARTNESPGGRPAGLDEVGRGGGRERTDVRRPGGRSTTTQITRSVPPARSEEACGYPTATGRPDTSTQRPTARPVAPPWKPSRRSSPDEPLPFFGSLPRMIRRRGRPWLSRSRRLAR